MLAAGLPVADDSSTTTTASYTSLSTPTKNGQGKPSGPEGFVGGADSASRQSGADSTRQQASFLLHCGQQRKTTYAVRVVCGDLIELYCTYSRDRKERMRQRMMAQYPDMVCGLVQVVDNALSFDLYKSNREFVTAVNGSTEFHFAEFSEQLSEARSSRAQQRGADGDVVVTQHATLPMVHLAFNIATRSKITMGEELNARAPLVAGLRNALMTAIHYDVTQIAIPVLLLDGLVEKVPSAGTVIKRAEIVLKTLRQTLLELQEQHTALKTIHLVVQCNDDAVFQRVCTAVGEVLGASAAH
eukprot:TRINITY_DN8296_c0_g1_i2.p1 TRINITY_DN8296_c0_g1~~TRINITY_DN8296_c0_g1_i2.p1  ORF type:complete len:300 (-),score=65.63 TRINITY_DN8296_c0_g1_i2:60-959(-)